MDISRKTNDGNPGITDFLASSWMREGGTASGKRKVLRDFSSWIQSVKNVSLATKARELWNYLHDKRVPIMDKAVIVAALLYCLSPADLIPDYIPFAGLLDDLSVVLGVLAYLNLRNNMDRATSPSEPDRPESHDYGGGLEADEGSDK